MLLNIWLFLDLKKNIFLHSFCTTSSLISLSNHVSFGCLDPVKLFLFHFSLKQRQWRRNFSKILTYILKSCALLFQFNEIKRLKQMHVIRDSLKQNTPPLCVAPNVDLMWISCFYHQLTWREIKWGPEKTEVNTNVLCNMLSCRPTLLFFPHWAFKSVFIAVSIMTFPRTVCNSPPGLPPAL